MSVKLLIAGESNSGKTTLTKDLENTLVINHDGKSYGFNIPHATIKGFPETKVLTDYVTDKVVAYEAKFGKYPTTIVFDSVSRIFDTLYDSCNSRYTGFSIYSNLDKEIKEFTNYIEDQLIASNMNVILISHAIYDADTSRYNLVGKGSFAKTGGFLAVVDESIFIETKNNKRIAHLKSTKFPARSLQEDLPDSTPVDSFNLQDHINLLGKSISSADEYELQ